MATFSSRWPLLASVFNIDDHFSPRYPPSVRFSRPSAPPRAIQAALTAMNINQQHLLYDLIYNPAETTFLRLGREQGAATKNGLEMLQLQAEKAWSIWNS